VSDKASYGGNVFAIAIAIAIAIAETPNREWKHLGALKPITDDMSKEEKLAIIQSEFERLYTPITLFASLLRLWIV